MTTPDRVGSAVAGFVLALVSLFFPVPGVDILMAIMGVVFSAVGLNSRLRGLAIAGLVIGILAVIWLMFLWLVVLAVLSA